MSYCREEGKDKIIFITKKDYNNTPSSLKLPEYEGEPGLILANGDINWNCPCLGGMATGPCGVEFRQAFTCVKSSSAEPRGVDCFDQFKAMQDCFMKYPKLYGSMDDDLKEDLLEQNGDENVKTN